MDRSKLKSGIATTQTGLAALLTVTTALFHRAVPSSRHTFHQLRDTTDARNRTLSPSEEVGLGASSPPSGELSPCAAPVRPSTDLLP
jgi:hypothetical protein